MIRLQISHEVNAYLNLGVFWCVRFNITGTLEMCQQHSDGGGTQFFFYGGEGILINFWGEWSFEIDRDWGREVHSRAG